MLISHKHRFIFIHIYKTAGTSISKALLPFATQNELHILLLRLVKKMGWHLPTDLDPFLMDSHASASQIIENIGREKYNSYFSFAFVRNPWDWQVSLFNFMRKHKHHPQHKLIMSFKDFDEYIRWRCACEIRFQKDFIFSSQNEPLVDYIGRYENLSADFSYICQHIGIQASLPILNVSKNGPYQSYYTNETVELVYKTFAPDIRLFNYNFE